MTPPGIGMKSPRRPPRERPSEELLASKYTTPCFFAGLDQHADVEGGAKHPGPGSHPERGSALSACPTCRSEVPVLHRGSPPPGEHRLVCPDPFHASPAQHVCEGPMDLMHWIPARRLRAAHAPVWDPRVVGVACRRHHHLLDNYSLRIPRDQLPPAVEEYAEQFGLLWSIDRDYPERNER